jgi:hypothetical protein
VDDAGAADAVTGDEAAVGVSTFLYCNISRAPVGTVGVAPRGDGKGARDDGAVTNPPPSAGRP